MAFRIVNYLAPEKYAYSLFDTCLLRRNREISAFADISTYFIHFMIIALQYQYIKLTTNDCVSLKR